jgi:hypothetical protein
VADDEGGVVSGGAGAFVAAGGQSPARIRRADQHGRIALSGLATPTGHAGGNVIGGDLAALVLSEPPGQHPRSGPPAVVGWGRDGHQGGVEVGGALAAPVGQQRRRHQPAWGVADDEGVAAIATGAGMAVVAEAGRHGRRHLEVGADPVGSGSGGAVAASCSSASRSGEGTGRRRRAARRRIPAAARGLKQYLEGADASTTADKEHAAASLGDAEVARVKHPPGNAVPELNQRSQDRREVPPLVGRLEAGDVLQQNPARTYGANDAGEVEEQPRAGSGEAGAAAGD